MAMDEVSPSEVPPEDNVTTDDTSNQPQRPNRPSDRLWSQLAAAVVMSMTPSIYAVTLAFGGLLLAESRAGGDGARLSIADATFVVSSSNVGRMAGCVVSSYLTNRLGVLRVIQLGTIINLLAWPLVALGSRTMVFAGAPLAGAVVGLTGFMSRLFIAEVTSSKYRPVLCILPGIAVGLSLLATYSLSAAIPWRFAVLICGSVPSAVQIIGTLVLPNSPRWLVNHNANRKRVEKAITFYRGGDIEVDHEVKAIEASLRGRPNLSLPQQIRLVLTNWDVGKPCLLILAQFTFETFTGGMVLNQYAVSVFQMAVTDLTAIQCSQVLAVIQMASLVVFACVIRYTGRRPVLVGAGAVTALGELVVALYFQFQTSLDGHTWLVLVGLVIANASSMGGIAQLTHLYCGELLSTSVRQLAGNVYSLYKGALSIAFLYIFPLLQDLVGPNGLFLTLVGVNVLQVMFARLVLPETKGMTLEEVQLKYYTSKKQRDRSQAESKTGTENAAFSEERV